MLALSDYPAQDEKDRLTAVAQLRLVGTPPAADFDSVLALALHATGCRSGLIGLMERDRHWFKAEIGLGCRELPRHASLGNHTLMQAEPVIIADLRQDARFRESAAALDRGVRFYAGIALCVEGGPPVGTLCMTDTQARTADPGLADALRHLGRVVEGLLAAHARTNELWKKARLFEQTERLAKIGAWEIDILTNAYFASNEVARIHELDVGDTITIEDARSRMNPELRDHVTGLLKRCLETGEGYEWRGELITKKGNRSWQHVIAEAEQQDGQVVRVFGIVRDMTNEHHAERTLWRAAHYDDLTQIPNRHYWTTCLDQAFDRALAGQHGLTIVLFDLDGFKEINDTRGHQVGDGVLRAVAQRLGTSLPQGTFYARLGGDEFAVLLEGSLLPIEIERIVRSVIAAVKDKTIVGMLPVQISATAGAASFPAAAATARDLMQKADIALYNAKRSHRSSFVPFRPEIGDLFIVKREAVDLVAAAIAEGRLLPFYQPKFDLKTGCLVGLEALCRIERADGTILGPAAFLPALQDPASAASIGIVMLDRVTADIAHWLELGLAPVRVAINVTGSDFLDGPLDRRVLDHLTMRGLPPSALEIEVTENTILGREAVAVGAALKALKDEGVIISLDDFGTGYASLTHLRDAPIHCIKLDRSFIAEIESDAGSAMIVKSIVELGHGLGLRIVAEGVETTDQGDFLKSIGCDEVQGFLFGRPASEAVTRALLEQRKPCAFKAAAAAVGEGLGPAAIRRQRHRSVPP